MGVSVRVGRSRHQKPSLYCVKLICDVLFRLGIQQAPAVGRAVMEMILDGEFVTLDLSRFNFDRFIVGQEVREMNIV